VAAAVVLVYFAWAAAFLLDHHTWWAFAHVGRRFASHAAPGSPIRAGLQDASVTDTGYDGQFFYYIAVDPVGASCCLDDAAYRYPRIGYPMAARLLGAGSSRLVPVAMVAINLAALGATILVLAAWLRRRGRSGWWALTYGFFPGVFEAFQLDLADISAYMLVAIAVNVLDSPRADSQPSRRVVLAGVAFGLAGLTRETTFLFAAVYILAAFMQRRSASRRQWLDAALLASLAALPLLASKAFVSLKFGSLGVGFSSGGGEVAAGPLAGLLSFAPFEPREWIEVAGLVAPATLVAALAVYRLAKGASRVELAAYLVNFMALVVFLQRSAWFSYYDSARVQTGVMLAAVLALPALLGSGESGAEPGRRKSIATLVVILALLMWLGIVVPGLAAPHTFHVFKL
jgi:hypothetical protein